VSGPQGGDLPPEDAAILAGLDAADGPPGGSGRAAPGRPEALSASRLKSMAFPPLRQFVPGLVCEGLTVLAGAPKAGKSWLALDMALSVADGRRFLGVQTNQAGVLYLALEDSHRRLQDRTRQILGAVPDWPDNCYLVTRRPEGPLWAYLEEWIGEHPDTGMVLVDTLGRVKPPQPPGGSAYDADYRHAGMLQDWAIERRRAVVGLHHDRKLRGEDWLDDISGTRGLTGAADTALLLRGERNDSRATLVMTSRELDDRDGWQLVRDGGPTWRVEGRASAASMRAQAGLGDATARIIEYLAANEDGATAAQVFQALPGVFPDAKRVGTYMARLADAGRIAKVGRGVYAAL
jgi:hypothetical protein